MTTAEARAAFGAQTDTLAGISPLVGQWAARVASGDALSDTALQRIAAAQDLRYAWAPRKVFAAVTAALLRTRGPLTAFVPTLGGAAVADGRFDAALAAFVDEHLDDVIGFLARTLVANNPADGVAMWRAVPSVVGDADLLVIGAGAGLELVADRLDPAITWAPRSRKGIDIEPIDVHDDASMRWLLGVCPPDDVERFERTRLAIELARHEGVRVERDDAVSAIWRAPGDRLVVMGASVLCSVDDPTEVGRALSSRSGTTWLVSNEVVEVHRLSGLGERLEARAPGDRVVRVVRYEGGEATIIA